MGARFFLTVIVVLYAGCSTEPIVTDPPAKACSSNTDCPSNQLCLTADGKSCTAGLACLCKAFTTTGCTSDAECNGEKCLPNGSCGQCATAADCGTGSDCVANKCVGTSCSPPGATQVCFVECHRGEQVCNNGNWSACNAPPLLPEEACGNGIDDDCNGKTDEPPLCLDCQAGATRPCDGPCEAQGQQICNADGTWGACDAPTDCTCEPGETTSKTCGNCGEANGTCGPDGTWEWSDICFGEGEQLGGVERVWRRRRVRRRGRRRAAL